MPRFTHLFTTFVLGLSLVACGATSVDAPSTSSAPNDGGGGSGGKEAKGGDGGDGGDGGATGTTENPFLGDCEAQAAATSIVAETAEVNGSSFLYAAGDAPIGLLLMFHGGGGDKEDFFMGRIDPVLIAQHARQQNYAIAALDSAAHLNPPGGGPGPMHKWNDDDSASNVDVVNALAMIARLRDAGDLAVIAADTPIYLMGVSHGGSIVSRLAQHSEVAAAVIYISNAAAFHEDGAQIPPVVLVPGENDPGQALGSNQDLKTKIEAASGEVELHINRADALSAGLFTRIPGVDCALSKAIGQNLVDQGWLDSQWKLDADPKTDTSWSNGLPAAASTHQSAIRDMLTEAYAGHSPSSDLNPEVFAFLSAH